MSAAKQSLAALAACYMASGSVKLFLGPSYSSVSSQPGAVAGARLPAVAAAVVLPGQVTGRSSPGAVGAAVLGAAAAMLLTAASRSRSSKASSGAVLCRSSEIFKSAIAAPKNQTIPVVDLQGNQIGEEHLQLRTFGKETANYVVHQAFTIWRYRQQKFTEHHPGRSDVKKGVKLWAQKGGGRARMGSNYSPLFGKAATNKNRHGLDDRRNKKVPRSKHTKAISTVIQSKWKGMTIVQGLEEIEEPRYYDLKEMITNVTGEEAETRHTLLITRNCYGKEHAIRCVPTFKSYRSPLYMAGRLIEKFEMRRPRDIDCDSDGLYQCLKARKLIVSREAFFDLKAKFNYDDGWAFLSEREIMVKQLQELVKAYPYDREKEFESALLVPPKLAGREFWAKEERDKLIKDALE